MRQTLEALDNEEKEYQEKQEKEKKERLELKKEDPEVEYKRRLVERFSYKNTDLIKKIYAENQVFILHFLLIHCQSMIYLFNFCLDFR